MGVAVARAIAEGGSIPIGIAQMPGHVLFLRIAHGFEGIKEAQNAVALFGARQVQRSLGQGVQALGQPHPFEGRGTGFHHNDGLRVGQADVFPAAISIRRKMKRGFSPASTMRASQNIAASGSEPRSDLMKALIVS